MLINVSPHNVPIMSIQNDWEESVRKKNDTAWVSCTFKDDKSIQGKLTFVDTSINGSLVVTASEGFTVEAATKDAIQIRYSNSPFMCVFIAAQKVYSDIHNKSIVSLDVSNQGYGVSASSDKMKVFNLTTGVVKLTLSGHVADIYKCRWFPSGEVILSSGADMQIKIWSSENGQCPATLMGHSRAVTDMAIIERGRNIISVSKDGRAKLWDCGKSTCLADLTQVSSAIYCCCLSTAPSTLALEEPSSPPSEREIGTKDKILLIGCEDGTVETIAVRSRKKLSTTYTGTSVNCCSFVNESQFIVGCQDGRVLLYSINEPTHYSAVWFDTNSPVLSLLVYKSCGFFSGHADGTCIFRSFKNACTTRLQLTGPNCDPIYSIVCDGKCIYTSTRDSVIRAYSPFQYILKFFDEVS